MGAKPAGGEGEVWSSGFVGVEVELEPRRKQRKLNLM